MTDILSDLRQEIIDAAAEIERLRAENESRWAAGYAAAKEAVRAELEYLRARELLATLKKIVDGESHIEAVIIARAAIAKAERGASELERANMGVCVAEAMGEKRCSEHCQNPRDCTGIAIPPARAAIAKAEGA